MPIEIGQLHIKSNVVQRAGDGDGAAAEPAAGGSCTDDDETARAWREQTLVECRRMIRDAIRQLQER